MNNDKQAYSTHVRLMLAGMLAAGVAGSALAHCDTAAGPVIPEARAALEKGDVTPLLKWVKKDGEAEIRAAFTKAVAVRSKGPDAKELADRYFLETLVRVHRAGEGFPYTGIKDGPAEPVVVLADRALEEGAADDMISKITGHIAAVIREKFEKAAEARKSKDKSVEAGREFVEAYVNYMHTVEGVHNAILSGDGHGHAESGPAPERHE